MEYNKITAAGKNLTTIGYTMIFGILISGEKAALALFIIAYLMMLFLFEIRKRFVVFHI